MRRLLYQNCTFFSIFSVNFILFLIHLFILEDCRTVTNLNFFVRSISIYIPEYYSLFTIENFLKALICFTVCCFIPQISQISRLGHSEVKKMFLLLTISSIQMKFLLNFICYTIMKNLYYHKYRNFFIFPIFLNYM